MWFLYELHHFVGFRLGLAAHLIHDFFSEGSSDMTEHLNSVRGCIFCDVIKGRSPSHRIYEDEYVVAFISLEGHPLIVPKERLPVRTFSISICTSNQGLPTMRLSWNGIQKRSKMKLGARELERLLNTSALHLNKRFLSKLLLFMWPEVILSVSWVLFWRLQQVF